MRLTVTKIMRKDADATSKTAPASLVETGASIQPGRHFFTVCERAEAFMYHRPEGSRISDGIHGRRLFTPSLHNSFTSVFSLKA